MSRALLAGIALVVVTGVRPSVPAASAGGSVKWLDQFGPSPDEYTRATNVAVDPEGNVFAAGELWTSGDGFLVKYNRDGDMAWTRLVRTGYLAGGGFHVAVDPAGNAVLVDVAAGSGAGQTTGLVAKYDAAGNPVWTRQVGNGATTASDVAADATGHVNITGTDARGGFLLQYDATGQELWRRTLPNGAATIALDRMGFIYVKSSDAVSKFDTAGNAVWSSPRPIPGDATTAGGFAFDAAGNAYLVGTTASGEVLPGQRSSGGRDAVLRKYDPEFREVWTHQFGTSGDDDGGHVAVGTHGAVVSGSTSGSFPGQPTAGGTDAFVQQFDHAGNPGWTFAFGTIGNDFATGVTTGVAPGDGLFVGGTTDGTFGGQSRTGRRDPFIGRIQPPR